MFDFEMVGLHARVFYDAACGCAAACFFVNGRWRYEVVDDMLAVRSSQKNSGRVYPVYGEVLPPAVAMAAPVLSLLSWMSHLNFLARMWTPQRLGWKEIARRFIAADAVNTINSINVITDIVLTTAIIIISSHLFGLHLDTS